MIFGNSIVSIFAHDGFEEQYISWGLPRILLAILSFTIKQIVYVSLSDAWTFLWWKSWLMLLVPPSSSSVHCFNSSKVIHNPCVLESQPVILLDKHCRMFSQLLHFLSYWTPFINPVIRFIDLCSKRWSITKEIVDHWLKLSDFLGFFLDFNAVACAFGLCWLIVCYFCFCCFY